MIPLLRILSLVVLIIISSRIILIIILLLFLIIILLLLLLIFVLISQARLPFRYPSFLSGFLAAQSVLVFARRVTLSGRGGRVVKVNMVGVLIVGFQDTDTH